MPKRLLLLLLTLALFSPACTKPMETRLSIEGRESVVDTRVAVAFASAVAAVTFVDAAETYYLDSKPRFTDAELDAAAKRVALIRASHETLQRLREHIETGAPRPDLRQLVADLKTLLQLAQAAGLKVDPKIAAPLAALEGFIQ